jgi:hypothetical protein
VALCAATVCVFALLTTQFTRLQHNASTSATTNLARPLLTMLIHFGAVALALDHRLRRPSSGRAPPLAAIIGHDRRFMRALLLAAVIGDLARSEGTSVAGTASIQLRMTSRKSAPAPARRQSPPPPHLHRCDRKLAGADNAMNFWLCVLIVSF